MSGEITEPLVSVIRERLTNQLDSAIAAGCLMALADRGVYTHRELPMVARALRERYPDLSEILAFTVDFFARLSGLPTDNVERAKLETIAKGGHE